MDLLRKVVFDGFTLTLWDAQRTNARGDQYLRYVLCAPDGSLLFDDDEFCVSPVFHDMDSDAHIDDILSILTLSPYDMDADYFDNYTAEQMKFAKNVNNLSWDYDGPEPRIAWTDVTE